MTPAQLTTLKAHITGSPDLSVFPDNADGHIDIATRLNLQAVPDFTVWRSMVLRDEVGKAFNATNLAGLTSANTDRLHNFAAWNDGVQPFRADQRQFFDDVFSGAGGTETRAALAPVWRRLATRVEKLFATGTGSDASPATLVIEGAVSRYDVEAAFKA